jgi:hypothetical protein
VLPGQDAAAAVGETSASWPILARQGAVSPRPACL